MLIISLPELAFLWLTLSAQEETEDKAERAKAAPRKDEQKQVDSSVLPHHPLLLEAIWRPR